MRYCLCILALLATPAAAAPTARCIDLDAAKKVVADSHATWIGLTAEQWQFLRGVFTLNPATAAGLPFGDSAAMTTAGDGEPALVFFLDGKKACDAMAIPGTLEKMVRDVGAGVIKHEGEGL